MTGKIIAIGGGEIADKETFEIDKRIVEEAGENSHALFIPTASEDAEGYVETFREIYGEELGCKTSILKLVEEEPTQQEIREKIENADLIYVGGGNTRKMMEIWRKRNVDRCLKQAYGEGTVLSGLSAGAICWFEYGHSDSESFETEEDDWDFIQVKGLGMVENIVYCPHYHSESREEDFREMMSRNPDMTGLAVDDNAAIEVGEETFRVIKSGNASAYRMKVHEGSVEKEELEEDTTYKLPS